MTATALQIADHFLAMDDHSGNWGTSRDNSKWNVDSNCYINGVMLTVDLDYEMGYLLEIVERSSSVVSYVALITYPNFFGEPKCTRDCAMMEEDAGTFFERNFHITEIQTWGLQKIQYMFESRDDVRRASEGGAD